MQDYLLIALSVIAGVAGQTTIKLGVNQPAAEKAASGVMALVGLIFHSPLVLIGLVLYGVGALSWIAVLSRFEISYAYPFLALNFVLIAVVSHWALGEPMPSARWLGIGIICVGIFVIARSGVS